VLSRLPYLALTGVFAAMRLLPVSEVDKDIEILVLRSSAGRPAAPGRQAPPRPG
jgi:hypothetical protein